MATKQGSKLSGKLGEEIHYIVYDKERVRKRPDHVSNPRTELQQAHRGAFADIARLSSHMTDALNIGLHYIARRKHTQPYLHFRSVNKDCFTSDGQIDYPRVVLSHGTIARVSILSITQSDNQVITIVFDPCYGCGNANPNDEFYLFAYCPALSTGHLFEPVLRNARKLTVTLPDDWLQPALDAQTISNSGNHAFDIHFYAFLRHPGITCATPESEKPSAKSRRGQTSTTIYIPFVLGNGDTRKR